MRSALLQPLKEHGDAVFGSRLPGLAQQPPEIVGERVLLGELDIDHGQPQPLAVIGAHQEMRDDDVLDVGGIELGEELLAEAGDCRLYVAGGQRLAGGGWGL